MADTFDPRDLQEAIDALAISMSPVQTGLGAMLQTLVKMSNPLETAAKTWDRMKNSVMDITDDLTDTIGSYKQLNRLAMQFSRLEGEAAKGGATAAKIVQEMIDGYTELKRAKQGDLRATQAIQKVLDELVTLSSDAGDEAKDLSAAWARVRSVVSDVKEEVADIDFSKPISGVDALSDGFGKALSGLKILDNYGFKGLFGNLESMRNKIKAAKDEASKASESRMTGLKATMKRDVDIKGMLQGGRDDRKAAIRQLGKNYADSSPEEQAKMVRMMSGRSGASGWLDRKLGGKVLGAAGEAAAGGAPMGLMARMGGSLMAQGGGSMMGGMSSVAMRAAGPLAAIYGLLQILQKGFDRNKDIHSALGGGMGVGTGSRADMDKVFEGWSQALTPQMGAGSFGRGGQGTAGFMGLDFEKTADAMKAVVEAGDAVTTRYGSMFEGPGGQIRRPDEVLGAGRATDTYSGVIRNAAALGKPLGMDSGEAARTSMKLAHEFALSMGEVEDMFVHTHEAMLSSGLTASKYLETVSTITGQFDKFNKSLNFTVGLISVLGKTAKYTGEDIQGMIKALTGEKKDLTQSFFAYQMMGEEGRKGAVGMHVAKAARTGEEVNTMFGAGAKDKTDLELRGMIKPGDKAQGDLVQRYVYERMAAEEATRNPSAKGLTALNQSMPGVDQDVVKNLSAIKFLMGGNMKMKDWVGGSAESMRKKGEFMGSMEVGEKAKVLGVDIPKIGQYLGTAMNQVADELKEAGEVDTTGKATEKATTAQKKLGLSAEDITEVQASVKSGKSVTDTKAFTKLSENLGSVAAVMTQTMKDEAKKGADQLTILLKGPLDFIQDLLKSVVDNLIQMLRKITHIASSVLFGKDEEDVAKEEKQRGEGFANNDLTRKGLEKNANTIQNQFSTGYTPAETSAVEQYLATAKEIVKVASTGGTDASNKLAQRVVRQVEEYAEAQRTVSLGKEDTDFEKTKMKEARAEVKELETFAKERAEGSVSGWNTLQEAEGALEEVKKAAADHVTRQAAIDKGGLPKPVDPRTPAPPAPGAPGAPASGVVAPTPPTPPGPTPDPNIPKAGTGGNVDNSVKVVVAPTTVGSPIAQQAISDANATPLPPVRK